MAEEEKLLSINILSLKVIMMWPPYGQISSKYTLKSLCLLLVVFWAVWAVFNGIVRTLFVESDGWSPLIQRIIACIDFAGMMYMRYCFLSKITNINVLIEKLHEFEEYCPRSVITATEEKVQRYTKAMIVYWLVGNVINFSVPLLDKKNCFRQSKLYEERDPCGLMTQSFHPFDVSKELFPVMYFTQVYACLVITYYVVALTMMMVGIMIHTLAHLDYCRQLIRNLNEEIETDSKYLVYKLRKVIEYHIKIIDQSERTNDAFSSMMMLHLTLTSIVISALGFEIVIVGKFFDCVRFFLHLLGWLVLLLLTCYYGQFLIDESTEISSDVYSIVWYHAPVNVQKDIQMMLMRSQKPLTLSAAGVSIMSFPTFLSVISSAYSYFTLLLNVKS